MAERQASKPEIAAQKRTIKLAPAIGDWTTYKPAKVLVKQVKSGLYGFDRLSKEEVNLALKIHYRFIQQALDDLRVKLNMANELYSVNIEQTNYLNFLRGLNGPVVQAQISIPNIHNKILVYISMPIVNSLINHSLGAQDLDQPVRSLTEAEIITLNTAFEEIMPHYSQSFNDIFENAEFSFVSAPEVLLDNTINNSSTFVYFSADIACAENAPSRLCIGYLGSTLKHLLADHKKKEEKETLDIGSLPQSLLAKIKVPALAKIGNTLLTSNEINALEVGDVVNLDQLISSSIHLDIGGKIKLNCQPGSKDKKIAVKLAALTSSEPTNVTPPVLIGEINAADSKAKAHPPAMTPSLPKEKDVEFEDTIELDEADEDLTEKSTEEEDDDDLFDEDFNDKDFEDLK